MTWPQVRRTWAARARAQAPWRQGLPPSVLRGCVLRFHVRLPVLASLHRAFLRQFSASAVMGHLWTEWPASTSAAQAPLKPSVFTLTVLYSPYPCAYPVLASGASHSHPRRQPPLQTSVWGVASCQGAAGDIPAAAAAVPALRDPQPSSGAMGQCLTRPAPVHGEVVVAVSATSWTAALRGPGLRPPRGYHPAACLPCAPTCAVTWLGCPHPAPCPPSCAAGHSSARASQGQQGWSVLRLQCKHQVELRQARVHDGRRRRRRHARHAVRHAHV